jgi:uncharacterized protein (DUF1778 family)
MIFTVRGNRLLNESGAQVGTFSQDEIELDNDALRYEVIRQAALYRGKNLENLSTEAIREQAKQIIKKELDAMEADRNRREDWEAHIVEQQKHILKLNSTIEELRAKL